MKILHLTNTPIAGFPYRLSEAVRQHTRHESRCIVGSEGYGSRKFPYDLLWRRDAECKEVLREADIYVLHSYFSVQRNPWKLQDYLRPHSRVTAHYCVKPVTANKTLIGEGIPTTVSAQYHARFFPDSRVMPNVMPINNPQYKPIERRWPPEGPLRIAYSPSNQLGLAHMKRDAWSVKGYPETVAVLKTMENKFPKRVQIEILEGLPLQDCLKRRSNCHVCIDEVVTGSYHNVFLEGMSQGLVSMAKLDGETLQAVGKVTGEGALKDPPWVNTDLGGLLKSLQELLESPESLRKRADGCRAWMEKNWDDKRFGAAYADFWEALPPYLSSRG